MAVFSITEASAFVGKTFSFSMIWPDGDLSFVTGYVAGFVLSFSALNQESHFLVYQSETDFYPIEVFWSLLFDVSDAPSNFGN